MRRKLIQQGRKSFTVTLPIKWLERYKIRDEVEVFEKDSILEIKSTGMVEEKPQIKELDISELPEFLFIRLLGSCYRAGYDELRFKCLPKQLKIVQSIVNELIGYEVIETKPDSLIIKRIVKSSAEQYYNSEKKCWHVLSAMTEDCLNGIRGQDKKALKAVITADSIIDRFTDYCMHMLLKYKDIESKNPFTPYLFMCQLEKIADILVEVAKIALHSKLKPNPALLAFHEELNHYITDFYLAYYRFDLERMKKLAAKHENLIKHFNKLIKQVKGPELLYLIYLKEACDVLSWLVTPLLAKHV